MSKRKKRPAKAKPQPATAAVKQPFNWEDSFLFQNKWLLLGLSGAYLLLYALITYCYPEPYFDPDSGTYILSARYDKISGYRPFGYSAVLQFFHYLSPKHTFVPLAQYLIMAVSGTTLLLAVKRFYPPRREWLFYLLCGLFILSPSTLYISTFMMSDSVFISLSWLWLASLFYLLHADWDWKWWLTFALHLVLMYWIIYIRYAGIVFPLVTTVAFLLRYKWLGLGMLPIAMLMPMQIYNATKAEMKKKYNYETYSGFTGWLKANNAMAMIPHIDMKPEEFDDVDLQNLHRIAMAYPDSAYTKYRVMKADLMWDNKLPLKQYFYKWYNANKDVKGNSYIYMWSFAGDMYNDYANTLIRRYPGKYFRYYLWPNFKRIFYMEFIHIILSKNETTHTDERANSYYGLEKDSVSKPRHDWYGKYFNGAYLKWQNVLKWLALLATVAFLFAKWRHIRFTEKQGYLFLAMIVLNAAYLGMTTLVVPNIVRLMLVVYAPQMILVYCVFNAFRQKGTEVI